MGLGVGQGDGGCFPTLLTHVLHWLYSAHYLPEQEAPGKGGGFQEPGHRGHQPPHLFCKAATDHAERCAGRGCRVREGAISSLRCFS